MKLILNKEKTRSKSLYGLITSHNQKIAALRQTFCNSKYIF